MAPSDSQLVVEQAHVPNGAAKRETVPSDDGASTHLVDSAAPSSHRASDGTAAAGGSRFRAVAQLIMAVRRFQATLNPTYSYGKRPSAEVEVAAPGAPSQEKHAPIGVPRHAGNKDKLRKTQASTSFKHRGHRTALLLSPLEEPET